MAYAKDRVRITCRIIAGFAFLAASLMSCESSILSGPAPAQAVSLSAEPSVAKDIDSLSLAFATSLAASCRVEYGKASGSYSSFVADSGEASTAHSLSLSGLAAGTKYYYRVVSSLTDSRSFASAEYSATTENAAYLTGTPSVTSSRSSLTISFSTSRSTQAKVLYGSTEGSYSSLAADPSGEGTSHSVSISGLSPGTVYYYQVTAAPSSSRSYASAEFSAATASEAVPYASKQRGIWLLGGVSATSYSDTVAAVDLYDPVSGAWYDAVTSLPTPVSFAGYAASGGKLFVIGGFDGTGAVRDIVQIYDIASNSWSNGESMNAARANVYATVLNGKIYVLGGSYGPTAASAWNGAATTFEYNIAGNSWTVGGRTSFGAAGSDRFSYAYNNAVYNLGGRTGATTTALTHDSFLPSLNALSSGTVEVAFGAGRAGFSGGVYAPSGNDGFVMIIGGISTYASAPNCFVNTSTSSAATTNGAYCLASSFTAPSAWLTAATAYPQSIAYGAAVVSTQTSPARIYQFGGTNALGVAASGLANGYWSAVPDSTAAWAPTWTAVSMPRGRWGHGALSLNN
jgi:hypothetical protein